MSCYIKQEHIWVLMGAMATMLLEYSIGAFSVRANRMKQKAHWLSVNTRTFAADLKTDSPSCSRVAIYSCHHIHTFTLYCGCLEIMKKGKTLLQLEGQILNIVQSSIIFASRKEEQCRTAKTTMVTSKEQNHRITCSVKPMLKYHNCLKSMFVENNR